MPTDGPSRAGDEYPHSTGTVRVVVGRRIVLRPTQCVHERAGQSHDAARALVNLGERWESDLPWGRRHRHFFSSVPSSFANRRSVALATASSGVSFSRPTLFKSFAWNCVLAATS